MCATVGVWLFPQHVAFTRYFHCIFICLDEKEDQGQSYVVSQDRWTKGTNAEKAVMVGVGAATAYAAYTTVRYIFGSRYVADQADQSWAERRRCPRFLGPVFGRLV